MNINQEQQRPVKKSTIDCTGNLIINGTMNSIALRDELSDRIFFRYSGSNLTVIFSDKNKNKYEYKTYKKIIENGELKIKSIIFYTNDKQRKELFLSNAKQPHNFYDSRKYLYIHREDLVEYPADELLTIGYSGKQAETVTLKKSDKYFTGKHRLRNGVITEPGGGDKTIIGGKKNDNLAGADGNDYIEGKEGNDALFGWEGHDTLIGGNGDDGLYGGAGSDILVGGEGNDSLNGDLNYHDVSQLESEQRAQSRRALGDDQLYGGKGNDRLQGGKGNDYLAGGEGNDLYVFAANDGINMIVEYAGEEDTIALMDHKFEELKFNRYGDHLVISSRNEGDDLTIVVRNQFTPDGYKVKYLHTKSNAMLMQNNSAEILHNLVINNPETYNEKLSQLNNDLAVDFRTHISFKLSEIFNRNMPDSEKLYNTTLSQVLIDKNNQINYDLEYNFDYDYANGGGGALPSIGMIIDALSSFAPKEAAPLERSISKENISTQSLAQGLFATNVRVPCCNH
ncbi:calcium-binding protein [Yersinia sp. 2540 StPb PI]|uniref:calcium-binding protein n=1 Tax=Yersinia sp. 2540 StPb PI TaxID=3117406 RepID=UPI003FA487C4